ncbi:uncharacterized protein LOC130718123 isoform X2 [Lotus japonicus]|uniref:uncharacterized protein LOC130718123 isoform X2 n=1 Tax=Lotus japonicus TaxID=34305 RepID=UPI00258814E0|nr:uncharacterized protein LOC130718123 isoform X2 [Lotus japonicus]
MNVGGSVWALDWCPQIHEEPDCSVKCEFVAVATHPPGSSYHKMGDSLVGRGVVQIWCLLNIREHNEDTSSVTEKRKVRPKKDGSTKDKSSQIKRPRGRPRKNSTVIVVDDTNCETQHILSLEVQFAGKCIEFSAPDGNLENSEEMLPTTHKRRRGPKKNNATNEKPAPMKRPRGRPKKNSTEVTASDSNCKDQFVPLAVQFPEDLAEFNSPIVAYGNCNDHAAQQCSHTNQKHAKKADFAHDSKALSRLNINHMEGRYNEGMSQPLLIQCENETNYQLCSSSELEPPAATCSVPDITLPRVVSCLAHNGKVAWDVKWRPLNISEPLCKYRMGYLAVLLGNGSLEVWEVPLPHVLRAIYVQREGIDPRFIKLNPVFKCSTLKRGGLQSIPLTVEWSVTSPHEYLLAGCHDGTVALWKFSANSSSKCDDTKPVLCFGGDAVPIRTVSWAPFGGLVVIEPSQPSYPESSNIIVTAGHEGLKFWDLRYFHPAPRIIYSLNWLSKPSCIIMSFDDGTMRTISLVKAANELPFTGTTYNGKKQPWLHSSSYSSFAIWSVHVSPITGMVAYCCADGTAIRFQLTTKAVETDHPDNRVPYFLCGSLSEEESTLIVNTPVSNTRFSLRKPREKGRHAQSFKELLSKANLSKSVNNPMAKAINSDCRTLALYDGDNLSLESGYEEALLSSREQPKRQKSKRPVESTAHVCTDGEKSDFGGEPEVFPPKMVALHRVRWNMNKGSERWLCFGGASDLLRCQEIELSHIDKKWALKR